MRLNRMIIVWAGILILGIFPGSGFSQEMECHLYVEPDSVKPSLFYNGADLEITASIPECDGIGIQLEGESGTIELNKKGKVGPIWMNVARVTVSNAPHVFICLTSENVRNLCSREKLEKIGFGYMSLKKRLTFSSEKPLDGAEFINFVKLQEHEGLYKVVIDKNLGSGTLQERTLTTTISIPSTVPSGHYQLYIYCFKDGDLICQSQKELTVEKAGFPRYMSNLAFGHPALYGIFAIIIAMATGATMGIVFSLSGKGGH